MATTLTSVKNSLRILKLFNDNVQTLGITDIATKLGIAKSTAFRLVTTLEKEGILRREKETGQYTLGLGVIEPGMSFYIHNILVQASKRYLTELRQRTNETAYLFIPHDSDAICLESVETHHVLRASIRKGSRSPLISSVCGNTILAGQDRRTWHAHIREFLESNESYTITRHISMVQRLMQIRSTGYAFYTEYDDPDLRTIACPFFSPSGTIMGAIAVTGPAQRLDVSQEKQLVAAVTKTAQQIGAALLKQVQSQPQSKKSDGYMSS
ncbi:MAG: IclR family transcriptional regulator [Alicyclobacillaceae bacterium]|nr:IclR family transcriptional regulator [Alicyclobacillaceae bacterium]